MNRLVVYFRIWNAPGTWSVRYQNLDGEWVECKRIGEARSYAIRNGFGGIKVMMGE